MSLVLCPQRGELGRAGMEAGQGCLNTGWGEILISPSNYVWVNPHLVNGLSSVSRGVRGESGGVNLFSAFLLTTGIFRDA